MKQFCILAAMLMLLPSVLIAAEQSKTITAVTTQKSSEDFQGMEIYFVRHARTLANELNRHTEDLGRTLSKKGKQQVIDLTERLNAMHFDHIIASPTTRTRKTIYPYLKARAENPATSATFKKAELWADLMECCWQKDASLPRTAKDKMKKYEIHVSEKYRPYFQFPSGEYAMRQSTKTLADGVAQMDRVTKLLKLRFSQSGKKILIVSHYLFLNQMIKRMAGIEASHKVSTRNAQMTTLIEQADGSFKMVMFNDGDMHGLDYPEYYEKYQRKREGQYQHEKRKHAAETDTKTEEK